MTDRLVTLRLTADGRGVAPGVRVANAELDKLGATGQAAGKKAQQGIKGVNEEIERTGRSAGMAETMLKRFLGAAAIAQALVMAGRTADAYADIVGKLRQVTTGERDLAAAKATTFNIAQRYFQNLDATVTLYGRATRALQEYGYGQEKAAKLTETVAAGLLVDRASVAESSSAILQLSQALGAGALRGEEFNAIAEAAPSLMKALADSLGVPRGALKKLAEEGQLTIDVLVDAFTGEQSAMLAAKASEVPLTIGRAWQQAKNDALRYVGEADQGIGASAAVAAGIALLSQNLGVLVTVATLAATVIAANLVQKGLRAAQAAWVAQSTVVNVTTASYLTHSGIVTTTTANTVRLTAAQTAAAVASRGLAAALAFVQANPIMLAVTAVVLLAGAFWQAGRAAEQAKQEAAELQERVVMASDAYADFSKTPTFQGIADLKAADDAFKELSESVVAAQERMREAHESYLRVTAKTGDTSATARRGVDEATAAYEKQAGQLRALTEAREAADNAAVAEMQKLLQLNTVSEQGQRTLAELAKRKREGTISAVDLTAKLVELANSEGNVARGAYLAENGLAVLQQRAANFSKILQGMDDDINSAIVNLTRLEKGQYQAWLVAEGQKINANGGVGAMSPEARADFNKRAAVAKYLMERTAAAQEKANSASKAGTAATREAAKATRDHARDLEQQQKAQQRYTEEVERMEAELQGPVRLAEVEHAQRIAEINRELAAKNITQADATRLQTAYEAQLKKTTAEWEKQKGAPDALIDTMTGEIRLLGMAGIARERYSRQLQNETDMRRAIADAIAAGNAGLAKDKERQAQLIANARAMADWSLAAEESARQAEEWANVWTRGVESAADALTDFVMSGLKDFKSLASSLKSIAKQLVGDLVRTFLQQKIVIPIQAQIQQSMSGQSGGGNIFQSIMGMFNGNGFSGGGQSNWLSTIGNLFGGGNGGGQGAGGWLSAFGSLFGGGGSAASAATSAGTTWGGLVGMANTSTGVTGASGAAAGGASGMASAIPIIGWIIAGMMKNAELFDQGWDINNGESWAGKVATLGAVGNADKLFRSLGFSDKISSILSGSSIHAKLFGRKKPQITAQGITGNYGFGGFEGQAYADIKQKGGWFRSSKYWTEYAALDSEVDKAFEGAIRAVKRGATDVAKKLGIDVSGQLANVRVNIGKIKLDADPEKAQQQIEAEISKMVESLSASAVRTLGFGRLLDNENPASEILTALQASIVLVTGSAQELGRALQDWEIENVTRAVEYFKTLASENGTSIAAEMERVVGLLGNYSSLMTDVDTQLRTAGLNEFQRQALNIELTYRDQIKAANDYAKALGLTGARAEDLAKIEQLRALNMATLQRQMEEQRNNVLADLSLGQYSPLTDAQKLQDAMQQLQAAVSAGDLDKASSLSNTALGLGRNLYASGTDYNSLYDQVTGLIGSIALPELEMDDGTTMGDLADELRALPDAFAQAMFALLYDPVGPTKPTGGNGQTTPTTGTGNNGGGSVSDPTAHDLLRDIRDRLGGGGGRNDLHVLELLR